MQQHRLNPLQLMVHKHNHEVNRLAWKFRKATGGQLRLAMLSFVPPALRPEVEAKVIELQHKHGLICKD